MINKMGEVQQLYPVHQIRGTKVAKVEKEKEMSLPGETVTLSGVKEKSHAKPVKEVKEEKPKKKADPSTYHYKPPFNVEQKGSKWVMHLPNADIEMPQKPVWMDRHEKLNAILDQNPNPPRLRKYADDIKRIAEKSYNASSLQFKKEPLNEYMLKVDDKKDVTDLKKLYNLLLEDETKSTFQVGGVMAGNNCSEMHKYGGIMEALDKRGKELS